MIQILNKSNIPDIINLVNNLSNDDLRFRFMANPSQNIITSYYNNINHDNTLISGIYNNNKLIAFSELSINNIAEFAVIVIPEYRNKGISTKLLNHNITFAKNNNIINSIIAICNNQNKYIKNMLKHHDNNMTTNYTETTAIIKC